MEAAIEGPAWATPGLDQREGRYPLAVEAPVLSMVATLAPGVSTLTQFARYYTLYWAVAAAAERSSWDAETCRLVVRRAEVLLADVSHHVDHDVQAHGLDALLRGREAGRSLWELAELGTGSYSPRAWGFWSQYGGPSAVLGTVTTEDGALRPGRHPCPSSVVEMFTPLIALASADDGPGAAVRTSADVTRVALADLDGPDLDELRALFTATRLNRHDPDNWTGDDRTRRSSLRVLARSLQLSPGHDGALGSMRRAVAHGPAVDDDPVLATEDRTAAWRGLLLRHRSVGAWRRLWAELVDFVHDAGLVTRTELHDWAVDRLPDDRVARFDGALPPIVDGGGHPRAAEDELPDGLGTVCADVAVLMLGARRAEALSGPARVAFLGGRRAGRGTYLDPVWVRRRVTDHADRSVRDLGRTLVDDMLAQAQRVALRKVRVSDGRLQLFSRLHERNGTYTAGTREGAGNVGLRIDQLTGIAEQLGLLLSSGAVTARGAELLELPA